MWKFERIIYKEIRFVFSSVWRFCVYPFKLLLLLQPAIQCPHFNGLLRVHIVLVAFALLFCCFFFFKFILFNDFTMSLVCNSHFFPSFDIYFAFSIARNAANNLKFNGGLPSPINYSVWQKIGVGNQDKDEENEATLLNLRFILIVCVYIYISSFSSHFAPHSISLTSMYIYILVHFCRNKKWLKTRSF